MRESYYLAFRYLLFHRSRTLILITCITLIAYIPSALQIILKKSETQLKSRAIETDLILGSKGSSIDLVMNSLYFQKDVPDLIPMSALDDIYDTELATAIPLYVRFQARNHMIVGTSVDYFDYRQLQLHEGNLFSRLGDCILGSSVANEFQLGVGDYIVSSSENIFDITGVYPLKMKVTGILKPSGTNDDDALFVDVKTTWVIQGLVHGHQDLAESTNESVILERDSSNISANAKLYHYNEITEDNLESFHFHGNFDDYPLSSILIIPDSEKSGTLLRGQYLLEDERLVQIVDPIKTVEEILQNIFKIKKVIDRVIIFVAISTLLALILVFSLSMKLRAGEMSTYFKMGSSKNLILRLFLAEITLILTGSLILNIILYYITLFIANSNSSILILN